jgi:Beta/Gamma crystallin
MVAEKQKGHSEMACFITILIIKSMRKNFTFSNLLVGLMLCLPMLVPAQVIVYEHGYYNGRSQTFGAGNHDMGSLNVVGNDQISSIRVPAGMSVIIYEHANYGGRSVTLTADNPDLSQVNFNDNVSSLRVMGGAVAAQTVVPAQWYGSYQLYNTYSGPWNKGAVLVINGAGAIYNGAAVQLQALNNTGGVKFNAPGTQIEIGSWSAAARYDRFPEKPANAKFLTGRIASNGSGFIDLMGIEMVSGAVAGGGGNTGGGAAGGAGNIPQGDMCWAASSPRGAGTIPDQCPPGQVMDAGLCYPQCNAGYRGVGPVCWADCPSGYRDDGAFCAKPAAYGRGGGYPWKFGDGFNLDKAKKRCEGDNPQGCEKNGEIMYPKCRGGFHATGCCICSPDCPPGFPDMGVSCTKPSYGRGAGKVPTSCSGGKENQGGLCYRPCEAGYKGIGPVCWANECPSVFPTKCAAGCAKSSNACFSSIMNQTVSVLEFAGNIAGLVLTGGGANAAKAGAKTAGKVVAKETIKQTLKRKAKEMGKELAENAAENAASTFFDAQATGEFSWEDLDPTGIANVVKAFNQPLCKDYR